MLKQNHEAKAAAEIRAAAISESFLDREFIKLRIYDSVRGEYELTGIITKIDQELRRVKVSHDQGVDWIPCDDILTATIQSE